MSIFFSRTFCTSHFSYGFFFHHSSLYKGGSMCYHPYTGVPLNWMFLVLWLLYQPSIVLESTFIKKKIRTKILLFSKQSGFIFSYSQRQFKTSFFFEIPYSLNAVSPSFFFFFAYILECVKFLPRAIVNVLQKILFSTSLGLVTSFIQYRFKYKLVYIILISQVNRLIQVLYQIKKKDCF